jgi:hypothetical protein
MALTITVTKKSVSEAMPGQWTVTFNMVVEDGELEVINTDYSIDYKTGDNFDLKQVEALAKGQAIIDKYKREQTIFAATKLNTLVTYLNTNLVG